MTGNAPAVTHDVAALPVPVQPAYGPAVRAFNAWLDGRPVSDDTVRAFLETERKSGLSASTLQMRKSALKAAVRLAFPSWDSRVTAAVDAVFKSVKMPKPDKRCRDTDIFSQDEIKKIIKACDRRTGLFVRALYNAGCRISELLGARFDHCREDKGHVHVRITGKGGRERTLVFDRILFKTIRGVVQGKTYLFESRVNPGQPTSRKTIYKHLVKAGREAVDRHVHPHAMRHSRITHLLADGVSIDSVSRFAGHVDGTHTINTYSHNTISPAKIKSTGL